MSFETLLGEMIRMLLLTLIGPMWWKMSKRKQKTGRTELVKVDIAPSAVVEVDSKKRQYQPDVYGFLAYGSIGEVVLMSWCRKRG